MGRLRLSLLSVHSRTCDHSVRCIDPFPGSDVIGSPRGCDDHLMSRCGHGELCRSLDRRSFPGAVWAVGRDTLGSAGGSRSRTGLVGGRMPITNVFPGVVSANIAGPAESSVTIARQGGPGWAYAQTSLVWSRDLGRAFAWISAVRIQRSPDQIDNQIFPDPGGSFVNGWFSQCLSVTFSLRIDGAGRASAIATLMPWEPS